MQYTVKFFYLVQTQYTQDIMAGAQVKILGVI